MSGGPASQPSTRRWLIATAQLARALAASDRRAAAREIFYATMCKVPGSYVLYERLRHPGASSLTNDPRAVIVEGYPGSGNSWTTYAIMTTNPDRPLAHHRHRPAQVTEGVRRGLPTLLLIRNPYDCIPSKIVRHGGDVAVELKRYIHFYESCLGVATRVEVVTFEQATESPADLVNRLNHRYAAGLQSLNALGPEPVELLRQINQRADEWFFGAKAAILGAAPSDERRAATSAIRAALGEPRNATALCHCRRLWEHYRQIARQQAATFLSAR